MISSLQDCRLAMISVFGTIPGIIVPNPLPQEISDRTLLIFPRIGPSVPLGRGKDRKIAITSEKTMSLEYHRRISYQAINSVIDDCSTMHDVILRKAWGEFSDGGGRFFDNVRSIENVNLMHFGTLGWNEWTFGIRIEVAFTYEDLI